MSVPDKKVAIVFDWITGTGGAERVIYELHKIFPDAPIYTSTNEAPKNSQFKNADIRTAWFQKLPKILRKYKLLTIPRYIYFSRLKLREYDVVISAGSAESKAVKVVDGVHINLCYTPTLYYWIKPEEYLNSKGTGGLNPVWKLGLRILTPLMKKLDYKAAQNPDTIYAISTAVQERIKQHYHRDSKLLYPPVDTERFHNDNQQRDGFVIFGRQVEHKRMDLAIAACNELRKKLVVMGDGPEHERLKAMAGPTIEFVTNVSDEKIVTYVSQAEAFIFPNEEDFGIVALESQAAGTPIIAYRKGGSLDTVIEGVTGEFFDDQTVSSLCKTLKTFNHRIYNTKAMIENADKFSISEFQKQIEKAFQDIHDDGTLS